MMVVVPVADENSGILWRISTTASGQPENVLFAAAPDVEVAGQGQDAGWKCRGERPCFTAPSPVLPGGMEAGWYELLGELVSADGADMLPHLLVGYASGLDGEAQISLPVPDARGRIRTLVLFKYAVSRLQFCPTFGSAQFRLHDFGLRRISRARALRYMLGSGHGGHLAAPTRWMGYLRDVARQGLSRATDGLYRDYRRRVLRDQPGNYAGWAARFDTITADIGDGLRARADRLDEDGPLVSVLLPVYQTPERWLRKCIDSVLNQAYPRWQLCIADDASPDAHVMAILREYASRDRRIEVMQREENGHISAASNSALAMARGEFVALLDHDDELRQHALLEVAEAIASDPGLQLLYSDEDKIDVKGHRFDPYFKPDFDPDLLRSQNYVCHLTTIRADLVRQAGGFRLGFEGSQDHDLILRCVEQLKPEQIRHIPKVLYHWRAIEGSTALTREAKDYASSAGARAVGEHLERQHPGAHVEELSHGHYRVRWPLPQPLPKVSLVIPTRDKVELLRTCIGSILEKTTYPAYEIVVVDNQSTDPAALAYLAMIARDSRVRVLRYDAPFNYSAINNWAVRQCDGAVVGLVNNDIEVITPDWLEDMVSYAWRSDVGAVGAMLYYPDDTIQHAGVILGVHGVAAHRYAGMPRGYPGHGGRARVAQQLSAVTGACLLVRREAFDRVGGLDEMLQVAFNDIDFCLRLREAGYRNIWTPFAELYHHESASRGSEDSEEKQQRFAREVDLMRRRWGPVLPCDPAYNPNLSLESRHDELASPPRGGTAMASRNAG